MTKLSYPHAGRVGSLYTYYVILLIWGVVFFRSIDLRIISILIEPIKAEFQLSDTQIGLLTGFAFAMLHGALGLPLGWLADRSNRRNIVAISLAIWSFMTAACGMAGSYLSLFLARVGVGIGEAGGIPPSYSLLSDYVDESRRASALAFVNTSLPIGLFFSLLLGGWITQFYGWRAAFLVAGVPGVVLAVLILLTLREPPRRAGASKSPTNVREAIGYLLARRSYVHLVIASSLMTMAAAGSGTWIPSFFVRHHGMTLSEVSTWLAFIYGSGGLLGAAAGGLLCDAVRRRANDARWDAWLPALSTMLILPVSSFVYLWPHPMQALLAQFFGAFIVYAWMGPCYSTIQGIAGSQRRAMAAAINLLVINIVSYGGGPFLIGLSSDLLAERFGDQSLGYAILGLIFFSYTWAALHFVLASRTLRSDLLDPLPAAAEV